MGDRCRKGPCPTCSEKLTGIIGSTQKSFGCIQKSCAIAEEAKSASVTPNNARRKRARPRQSFVFGLSIVRFIPNDRVGSPASQAAAARCPPELRRPLASSPPL